MADGRKITAIMAHLGCTREEAIDIIKSDEEIEKGELLFELSDEQKKAVKQVCNNGVKKRTKINRERKVDETKKSILADLAIRLEEYGAEVKGTKTETEIDFDFEGEKYTLKLTKHRPPKKKSEK